MGLIFFFFWVCLDPRNFVIICQTPLSISSMCDQVVKAWAIFVHPNWISARFSLTPCASSRFFYRKKVPFWRACRHVCTALYCRTEKVRCHVCKVTVTFQDVTEVKSKSWDRESKNLVAVQEQNRYFQLSRGLVLVFFSLSFLLFLS